ncbi:MAG TPA: NlpC/P60 family protein [Campylobacterales bacterium]|nr:NlpC/P60 family protein [Campylobacterales bacterium]HHC11384.1 NlpC/P60 family protein [Campylobacterales bacterium]
MPLASIFPNNPQILTKNIEYKAKTLLGKPYVWGATGPKCFDCSGFTQKVYRSVGINLPRVSRSQAKVGELVRFNELQKGDMVFFDTSHQNQGKVNHVGIYLEDGKFIHASSGNHKVVITSFDKKRFYKNRFLWGRRIIKTSFHSKLHTKLANIVNLKQFPKAIQTQEL